MVFGLFCWIWLVLKGEILVLIFLVFNVISVRVIVKKSSFVVLLKGILCFDIGNINKVLIMYNNELLNIVLYFLVYVLVSYFFIKGVR